MGRRISHCVFGFVPVGGTYYVQALNWTPDVTVASLVCGLIVDTLLVVNNYRDRDADRKSGKKTVVVRFGEPFGRYFYLLLGIIAAWLCFWFYSADIYMRLSCLSFTCFSYPDLEKDGTDTQR